MKIIVYRNKDSKRYLKTKLQLGILLAALAIFSAVWLQSTATEIPSGTSCPVKSPDRSLPIQEISVSAEEKAQTITVQTTVETVSKELETAEEKTKETPSVTTAEIKPQTAEKTHDRNEIPLSAELQQYTRSLCTEYEVPYALALAIIEHESNFDVDATHLNPNGTTDSGLMQLNEVVAEQVKTEYAVTDLMDPKQNLLAGISILSDYLSRHSISDTVMAYINGEAGMKRLKAAGITTTESTDEVLALMEKYEVLL